MSHTRLLLGSCHLGPALAVTGLAGALAAGARLPAARTALLGATVLTGQLSIGWANDLVDRGRDARTGRPGKPLAQPGVSPRPVVVALGLATGASLLLGARCGRRAGAVHAVAVVGAGLAYDLGLKATAASPVPYAVAFGALPHVVSLADPRRPVPAPSWHVVAGALLGVGAHLLDALPDLSIDTATGVNGFPHRVGARRTRRLAGAALAGAHAAVLLGARPRATRAALLLGAVAALGVWAGPGTVPFWSAAALAGLDVGVIGAASRSHDAAASVRADRPAGHPWG